MTPGPKTAAAPFRVDGSDAGEEGFAVFFAASRDNIARTLVLALDDESLGYEAADEAMVRAFRDWEKVSTYDNPEGWVFKVGLNWGRSWIRRRVTATLKAPIIASRGQNTDLSAEIDDPDLAAAIGDLSTDHRVVVVLRFYRDWPVAKIAETLGVAEGTVKSRLSRALRILGDRLSHSHALDGNASEPSSGQSSGREVPLSATGDGERS